MTLSVGHLLAPEVVAPHVSPWRVGPDIAVSHLYLLNQSQAYHTLNNLLSHGVRAKSPNDVNLKSRIAKKIRTGSSKANLVLVSSEVW